MILFSLLPNTKVSKWILKGAYLPVAIYFITFILFAYFYIKSCSDPFYVQNDDIPLDPQEELWYCKICNQYCPLRASHCKQCNKCVLRKDHHCPFLGQCVGMGNHFYFLLFNFFLIVFDFSTMYVFNGSMIDGQDLDEWILTSLPCTTAFVGSMISIFQPLILLPIHSYLALANKTTWEYIKDRQISYLKNWKRSISPFSKGLLNNFKEFATMHRTRPVYHLPTTDDDILEWKAANSCLSNENYECC